MVESTQEALAETAMCLWEYFLEHEPKNYVAYRETFGVVVTRMRVLSWAEACDTAWNYAAGWKEYDDVFDWHFVPLWCEHCINDNFELIISDPEEAFVLMFGQSVTEDKTVEELKNEIAELRNLLAQAQKDLAAEQVAHESTKEEYDRFVSKTRWA